MLSFRGFTCELSQSTSSSQVQDGTCVCSEIDRAADYWKQRGGISRADLKAARDKSDATVIIQDNRVSLHRYVL